MVAGRKVLRVCMESDCDSRTEYIAIEGSESEKELLQIAEAAFFNWANFGHSIIDESEVPKGEEIIQP